MWRSQTSADRPSSPRASEPRATFSHILIMRQRHIAAKKQGQVLIRVVRAAGRAHPTASTHPARPTLGPVRTARAGRSLDGMHWIKWISGMQPDIPRHSPRCATAPARSTSTPSESLPSPFSLSFAGGEGPGMRGPPRRERVGRRTRIVPNLAKRSERTGQLQSRSNNTGIRPAGLSAFRDTSLSLLDATLEHTDYPSCSFTVRKRTRPRFTN